MEPRDIKDILLTRYNAIDVNKLYQKLENKIEKSRLNDFIFKLDSYDGKQDQAINFLNSTWLQDSNDCFRTLIINEDPNSTTTIFDKENILRLFGYDASDDLELLANAVKEIEEDEKNEFIQQHSDIPSAILRELSGTEYKFEKIDAGYKVIQDDECYDIYDEDGNCMQKMLIYEDYDEVAYYNKDGSPIKFISKYKNGLVQTNYPNGDYIKEFGKTRFVSDNDNLTITVNQGLPNETSFKVVNDEDGDAIDIIPESDSSIVKVDELNKNALIGLLNSSDSLSDYGLGCEFDITCKANSVDVEIIKEDYKKLATSVKNDIKQLITEGKYKDYKISKLKTGETVLKITNLHGLDYEGDGKNIIYSADGKTKTTYFTNGDKLTITQEENGEVQSETYDRKEFFSSLDNNNPIKQYRLGVRGDDFYTSDFEDLFDLQSAPAYYREQIVASSYKLEDYPEVMESVCDVSDKNYISDSEYTQTIDNVQYNIKKAENELLVTVNNQTYSIDLTGIHKNIQKTLFKANPKALARIAQQNIKLSMQNIPCHGLYDPETNTITLNPNSQNVGKLLRSLVHETGHSYYTADKPVNEELESTYKKELEYFKNNCAENNLRVTDDCAYATNNVYEMVAECYTLITNGNARSEFVISNYFPETFKLVKNMVSD